MKAYTKKNGIGEYELAREIFEKLSNSFSGICFEHSRLLLTFFRDHVQTSEYS
ncbi:hypothetical protein KKHLCK_03560 [Candidatus Electrothrix laxa]